MFALPVLLVLASWAQSPSPASQQIVVRNVRLNGVDQLSPSEQQQVVGEVQRSYGIASFSHINDRLREALQTYGFYKASVAQPMVTIVSGTGNNGTVDVAFDIHEGQRYRLKAISFTHNHVFSPEDLRRTFGMHDGDIFNTAAARHAFSELRRLYVDRGYVDFQPIPEVIVDEPNAMVTLLVDMVEGMPYRVGSLAFGGAEDTPGTKAKLLSSWTKYEGQTYSSDLLSRFIRENAWFFPPNVTAARAFRITVDQQAHLLNFRLELVPATVSSGL
jgi:outer membrane protein insertion porin family